MPPADEIDEEDRHLFRQTIGEVRRLNVDRMEPAPRRPPPDPQQLRMDERRVLDDLLERDPETEVTESGEGLWFARPGIPDRTLRKLRRGKFSVAAELDLHGMGVEQAREALGRFLGWASTQPSRCVRIIHGKGRRSAHGPILKHKVFGWLQRREEVLAVCSAQPVHGGSGAVYVLLQRRR